MEREDHIQRPAQDPNFLQVPSAAPPGATRGPHRARTRRRRRLPVPIEQIFRPPPFVDGHPVAPPCNMTYEAAIKFLEDNPGAPVANRETMAGVKTTLVLYEPLGGVLRVTHGPTLEADASVCFLVTWLQIFTDNFMAKRFIGGALVVRSIEFQLYDGQGYQTLPNLEGGLSYSNCKGVVTASVSWPCDSTVMEKYWQLLRAKMHVGGDGLSKYPIIKIKTVRYLADVCETARVGKILGSGHKFVVSGQEYDIYSYFQLHGQRVPPGITELDGKLTKKAEEEERKALAEQNARDQVAMGEILRRHAERKAGRNNAGAPGDPQQVQGGNETSHAHPTRAEESKKIKSPLEPTTLDDFAAAVAAAIAREEKPASAKLVRGQPLKKVSVPMGGSTVDLVVPFRPAFNPDPRKNWGQYQRAGGDPQMHDAFPLEHMPFDKNDMPNAITPPLVNTNFGFKDGEYYMQNTNNNEMVNSLSHEALGAKKPQPTQNGDTKDESANAPASRFTAHDIEDYWERLEEAIGLSEEDDLKFFPNSAVINTEGQKSSDNYLTVPIHRHGHRPSQNEDVTRGHQTQEFASVSEPDGAVAIASRGPSRASVPEKKASTMNVNAPEFVNTPTSMNQTPDYEFKPALATGYSNYLLSDITFSSTMPYNPRPYVSPNPELYAAAGNSQHYGEGNSHQYGAANSHQYGTGNPQSYGAGNPQQYGGATSQQYGAASQEYGAGQSQQYGVGNPQSYSGAVSQPYGTGNSQRYGTGNSQPFVSAPGQNNLIYPGLGHNYPAPSDSYKPSLSDECTTGGDSMYKPAPTGPAQPNTGSSKIPSSNTAFKNFNGHQRGKAGCFGAVPTSLDAFVRRGARPTFGEAVLYEAKENPFNSTGNKTTPNRGPSNTNGPKGGWRIPHSRGL